MIALLLVGLATGGSCAGPADDDVPAPAQWRRVALPVPEGPAGRVVPRDVIACGDRWYVVGGVETAAGGTRPAAWVSTDAESWTPVAVAAESFYGRQALLYSVGCRAGGIAAVGAKVGGVHGNPRVVTWRQTADGSLAEVPAAFESYGGGQARNVGRIAGGPGGWLIVGNRVSGAAVWASPDAAGFELRAGVPELASDERGVTWAYDVAAGPAGWVLAGAVTGVGPGAAVVWTSADGAGWRRFELPVDGARERPQRVVVTGAGPVVLGVRGSSFGAWSGTGDQWRMAGRFGSEVVAGTDAVQAVTPYGAGLVAVTWQGTGYGLWLSPDAGERWRPLAAPDGLPIGGDRSAGVAGADGRLLLAADDGREGQLWVSIIMSEITT